MGHLTCLDVFSFKKTKKHIECCVNEVARKEGDYGKELPKPIRWYENKIYNSSVKKNEEKINFLQKELRKMVKKESLI